VRQELLEKLEQALTELLKDEGAKEVLDHLLHTRGLTWTIDKPTTQGWYWYRETPMSPPHPVKIFSTGGQQRYVWPLNDFEATIVTKELAHCPGEFAGPLESPA
jgi:hypothetical protein